MKNLITICGRGGSKGLKNKNIKEINGHPLLYYSIQAAMRFKQYFQADVALSTDSDEIRRVADNYGISESYLRPSDLSTDQAGKLDVIDHLVKHKEAQNATSYDYILDLDITSPLRTQEDLLDAFQQFVSNDWALNMFSVSKANRNPYFNMVEDKGNGKCQLVKGKKTFLTRQSAPRVFDIKRGYIFFDKIDHKHTNATFTIDKIKLCKIMSCEE